MLRAPHVFVRLPNKIMGGQGSRERVAEKRVSPPPLPAKACAASILHFFSSCCRSIFVCLFRRTFYRCLFDVYSCTRRRAKIKQLKHPRLTRAHLSFSCDRRRKRGSRAAFVFATLGPVGSAKLSAGRAANRIWPRRKNRLVVRDATTWATTRKRGWLS